MERFLTYKAFLDQVKKLDTPYWNRSYETRWNYMKPIIDKLKMINPSTAIEIGTAGISLMTFSDTIDISKTHISNKHNKTYLFDASKTPWNIPDKKYDMFIGLQVLEHLGPNQSEVFKEIKRISKEAIITLPYKWNTPDTSNCHYMIDDEKILEWTENEKPYTKEIKPANNKPTIEFHYIF